MSQIDRVKYLVGRAYSALLRSESHYFYQVRQQRKAELGEELKRDPLLVTPYGWSGYSQHDDDGIVQEIFRRIGIETRSFIEFGAGDCLTNTGTYLLLSGWRGTWLEANGNEIRDIQNRFGSYLNTGDLKLIQTFITPENINTLIPNLPLDLLVIDIDGNDYYIWEALEAKPRVLMIEYNPTFRPPAAVVQEYTTAAFWHGENFYGASLSALEIMGRRKGYCLVGCNYAGGNAFFVREDLMEGRFSAPFTAEHHYREQLVDGLQWGSTKQVRGIGGGKVRYQVLTKDGPGKNGKA